MLSLVSRALAYFSCSRALFSRALACLSCFRLFLVLSLVSRALVRLSLLLSLACLSCSRSLVSHLSWPRHLLRRNASLPALNRRRPCVLKSRQRAPVCGAQNVWEFTLITYAANAQAVMSAITVPRMARNAFPSVAILFVIVYVTDAHRCRDAFGNRSCRLRLRLGL